MRLHQFLYELLTLFAVTRGDVVMNTKFLSYLARQLPHAIKLERKPTCAASTLLTDTSGSVAIIFALSILVLCGTVAIGVDYARALAVRSQLQSAVDAAALSARTEIDQSSSNLATRIQANFAYGTRQDFGAINIVATPTPIEDGIRVSATATVPTTFGRVLGINTIPVTAVAEAVSADPYLELALALDNTGSMLGSKLAELKIAANHLVDKVVAGSTPGRVKFSLVPFSQYVNVGTNSRGATWLSVPDDGLQTVRVCSPSYGPPVTCQRTMCYGPLPYPNTCGYVNVNHTWNGCVGSRAPSDFVSRATGANPIPGIPDVSCTASVGRLSPNVGDIKTKINNMIAEGWTYIPAGLMWGWRTLSPDAPFSDGAPFSRSTKKIIVLMTDGENTKSQNGQDHDGDSPSDADTNLARLCQEVKRDGIELYTVSFQVPTPTIKAVLATCSSGSGYNFDAITATDLNTAFDAIAVNIIKLALRK
jgi:Flp pilus assembly protein TadG